MHIQKTSCSRAKAWSAKIDRHHSIAAMPEEFSNAVNIVAASQGVSTELILSSSRSRADVAMTRHIAMYVVHVTLGYTMTQTGLFFDRVRTTVSHACARVEDMRDDKDFDQALTSLEMVLSFGRITKSACGRRHLQ